MNFQEMILTLQRFWAGQGCLLWNPYNVQVGAGTNNPATLLRVLGPEAWRVAYVEPSIRPDDGRYGENPNRMQRFLQFQVILKPEPGNPQELYLASLAALGIESVDNDIRFVEDNWQSPPLGAWGLGWEVWLNGQEIAQFTYFQQAAGLPCEPVSVEITYGLERMAMAIQARDSVWDIAWLGELTYGDVYRAEERAHCQYYFELADVDGLRAVYEVYAREHERALSAGSILPAYDYVLKCNHIFNVLDTRGAVGVTERAHFFRQMRGMTLACARAYLVEREALGFPLREKLTRQRPAQAAAPETLSAAHPTNEGGPADFLLEIGVEELPVAAQTQAEEMLRARAEQYFAEQRLQPTGAIRIHTTPRRLVLFAPGLPARQPDSEEEWRGPPAQRAYDADGQPTAAASGFARSKGLGLADLRVEQRDGGEYVVARVRRPGSAAAAVLAQSAATLIAGLRFAQTMRWNEDGGEFSRPIRWLVALLGQEVLPLSCAGLQADRETRGSRQYGAAPITLSQAADYGMVLREQGIIIDAQERRQEIEHQIAILASGIDAELPDDEDLLTEVTRLIEVPKAFCGHFDPLYLDLPAVVLSTVMKKHQRYFPTQTVGGELLPHFLAVRDGDERGLAGIREGNEQVLAARFADARFFYEEDRKQSLEDHLPRLETLIFHEKLGSMRAKSERLVKLVPLLAENLGFANDATEFAAQAAHLCKADLATKMVVELTALQGEMGRIYARADGWPEAVAQAIYEHWLPRGAGDELPQSSAGVLLALADQLDSLIGLMGVAGLRATASSDPYGLRRAALGITRILIDCQIDAPLQDVYPLVARQFDFTLGQEANRDLQQFVQARFFEWLSSYSQFAWSSEAAQAVMAFNHNNPYRASRLVRQLMEWSEHPNWESILDAYARCARISKNREERKLVPALFVEEAERALYEEYEGAREKVSQSATVDTLLSAMDTLQPAITRFFDEVLVMAEERELRQNRLALLKNISELAEGIVDLAHMPGY